MRRFSPAAGRRCGSNNRRLPLSCESNHAFESDELIFRLTLQGPSHMLFLTAIVRLAPSVLPPSDDLVAPVAPGSCGIDGHRIDLRALSHYGNSRVAAPKHRNLLHSRRSASLCVQSTWGRQSWLASKVLRWYELMSSGRGGKGVLYQSGWVENAGHPHARHALHAAQRRRHAGRRNDALPKTRPTRG